MHCLRTEKLCKTYNGRGVAVRALADVSLQIAAGEFVAIAGPSGSGKTTLLDMLGGLDVPDSGKVCLGDVELTALDERELASIRLTRIGFVFQEFNLIPVLSARENVEYMLLLQGRGRQQAKSTALDVLAAVGLDGLAERRPNQLSGGQQQRVAVARAIVTRPSVVLADEPTANLDSATGQKLIAVMHDLNSSLGISFVFCTHDSLVMESATRVIRMRDGAVQEEA